MSTLQLIFLTAIPFLATLCSSFSPERPTDRRILVLLDDLAIRSSHSIFLNSLQSRGFDLDFKLADDPKISLHRYGQYLYDGLILFSPTVERFGGSIDLAAIMDFVDAGHDLIMGADSSASNLIREIATECGVDFDEDPGAMVIDHISYAVSQKHKNALRNAPNPKLSRDPEKLEINNTVENMEKPKKQEKHKMAIRVGSGGGVVGGVVLWGGVVAAATFLSVSAIRLRKRPTNKSHNHPPPPPPPPKLTSSSESEAEPIADLPDKLELKKKENNDDDQGKGLHVLLQDYSPLIDYHPSTDGTTGMPVTQIDSTSSDFTKTSILDDNSVLDISGPTKSPTYLEILLSDKSKPKNSLLITDYGVNVNVQEYSLPVLDGPSLLKSRNMNKNEHIGDTVDVEEDNLPMELIEKGGGGEVEEHDDVENTIEIGEVVVMEGDSIVSEVIWEDKAVEAPHVGQIEEVDNRHTQLIETVIEKGEETIETAEKDQFEVEVDQEAIKVTKEEAAYEATDAVHIEAEYNPKMQLIKEEQENDDGGIAVEKDEAIETVVPTNQAAGDQDELQVTVLSEDEPQQVTVLSEDEDEDEDEDDDEMDVNEDEDEEEIVEKGEESSDGTGDSSMESNAEAIWPAESIQELSLEFKELKIINKTLDDKIDETEDHGCYSNSIADEGNIYVNGHHKNEETGKSIVTTSKGSIKELLARIKLSTDSSNTRIWISPSSVLLVLLLLVMPLLLSPANILKLCLIIFLVVILSQV